VVAGLLAGAAGAALPAGPAAGIEVVSAVAPAPPPGAATMAVYLQLRNIGATPDALLAASTPLAGEAMIHVQQLDGGIMRMRMLARLEIPAGTTLAMHAGGVHVMLAALSRAPRAGEQFPIRLHFERARELTAQVQVLPLGSAP
jgi:copper(I)-binding protein